MDGTITISWAELLSACGVASVLLSLIANYFRVTVMSNVRLMLDDRLDDYVSRETFDLEMRAARSEIMHEVSRDGHS